MTNEEGDVPEPKYIVDWGKGEVVDRRVPYGEHLVWVQQRALEYLDRGDTELAVASLVSDLRKHAETRTAQFEAIGSMATELASLRKSEHVRALIDALPSTPHRAADEPW